MAPIMCRRRFSLALCAMVLAAGLMAVTSMARAAPVASGPSGARHRESVVQEVPKRGSVLWKRRHLERPIPGAPVPKIGQAAAHVVTLRNLHTGEVLSIPMGTSPSPVLVDRFLRCRWTHRVLVTDPRLIVWVLEAARHFGAQEIHVVSGFRHPKFNEVLRKKGREVAPRSQHRLGRAVDFRLVGVEVEPLFDYLRRRRIGGVGRYPQSQFVHLDSGPVRTWGGR